MMNGKLREEAQYSENMKLPVNLGYREKKKQAVCAELV